MTGGLVIIIRISVSTPGVPDNSPGLVVIQAEDPEARARIPRAISHQAGVGGAVGPLGRVAITSIARLPAVETAHRQMPGGWMSIICRILRTPSVPDNCPSGVGIQAEKPDARTRILRGSAGI